jgi:hypothetical protein
MRPILGVLFLSLFAGLTYANYQFSLEAPGGNDFLARWNGARYWLVEGISPYDRRVSVSSQTLIYGRPARPDQGEDIAHFVYPLPAMVFFGPFGLLPYPLARATWMTILELGLPVLAILGLQRVRWRPPPAWAAGLLLFSVLWYHGLRSIVVGQFAVIDAVLMAAGLLCIRRGEDLAAGIALALASVKPQMPLLLVPFVLIWAIRSRRHRLAISLVGSMVTLYGLSLLLLPGWPIEWARQLAEYPSYTALGSPVSIAFSGLGDRARWPTLVVTGVGLLYLFWEWRSTGPDDPHFQWTADLTLVITNLVAFRTATTNFVALLPALIHILSVLDARWGRAGRISGAVVLLTLFAGLWGLFLTTLVGNEEAPALYLPLPLMLLLGLWWIRWWVVRGLHLRPELRRSEAEAA